MRYGYFRQCITPPIGTGLAGYLRKPTSEGVYDDLYLQMLLLEDKAKKRLLLISGDIIGLDHSFVQKMRKWMVRQDNRLDEASINFNVTHTHCGPATCLLVPSVGTVSEKYMAFLEASIKKGLKSLLSNDLMSASLYCGIGTCKFGINRRLLIEEEKDGKKVAGYQMRPNINGSTDTDLGVVLIKGRDHEVILVNYACHPTTRGGYIISGDYPGAAMRVMRANSFHKREAMFLQGGGGDIKVPSINDEKTLFMDGDGQSVVEFGNVIVKAVDRILKKGLTKIESSFSAAKVDFLLPYDKEVELCADSALSAKEFIKTKNRRLNHESTEGIVLEWTVWRLSKECVMTALPGEVCHMIGKNAKRISSVKFPFFLGYTNGCPAYIPTDDIIRQGGYEGKDSNPWFGHPYPLRVGSEKIIYGQLKQAVAAVKK